MITLLFKQRFAFVSMLAIVAFVIAYVLIYNFDSKKNEQNSFPDSPVDFMATSPEENLPYNPVVSDVSFRAEFGDNRETSRDSMVKELELLDQELKKSPMDPRVWWWRSPSLTFLGRTEEALASRTKAIQLAKAQVQYHVLLPKYFLSESFNAAQHGYASQAAYFYIQSFESSPIAAYRYKQIQAIVKKSNNKKNVYGTKISSEWGEIDKFFENFNSPSNSFDLKMRMHKINIGMDYKDVPKNIGFPLVLCLKHGDNLARFCWLYHLDHDVVAIENSSLIKFQSHEGLVEVHVCIYNNKVVFVNAIDNNK